MNPPTPLILQTWTAPNGVPCMVRQYFGGALCGYVFVEDGVDLQDLRVHGGITGGHRGDKGDWLGFDTGHGGDDDPSLPDDLRVGLRVWTEDDVRAETERLAAQVPAPAPWPRWCFEPMNGAAMLALREKTGETWASLRRVIRPKGEVIWWHHAPKKCSEQKVPDLETGAAALRERGLPEITSSQLAQLRAWTP